MDAVQYRSYLVKATIPDLSIQIHQNLKFILLKNVKLNGFTTKFPENTKFKKNFETRS